MTTRFVAEATRTCDLQFRRSQVWWRSLWVKTKVPRGLHSFLEAFLLIQVAGHQLRAIPGRPPTFLAHDLLPIFKGRLVDQILLTSPLADFSFIVASPSPSPLAMDSGPLKRTHAIQWAYLDIQDNLPISRSTHLITSAKIFLTFRVIYKVQGPECKHLWGAGEALLCLPYYFNLQNLKIGWNGQIAGEILLLKTDSKSHEKIESYNYIKKLTCSQKYSCKESASSRYCYRLSITEIARDTLILIGCKYSGRLKKKSRGSSNTFIGLV